METVVVVMGGSSEVRARLGTVRRITGGAMSGPP